MPLGYTERHFYCRFNLLENYCAEDSTNEPL